MVGYDRIGDMYYDVVSVLIKFMRVLDSDAMLYYFVCMIEVGEEFCFIFRCLVVFVAEDVFNADPCVFLLVVVVVQGFE